MGIGTAITVMQQALTMALVVPAPILAGILLVGFVISLFQAVTQIHEMTLVFIPKVVVTFLILYISGNWMLFMMVNYSKQVFQMIPNVTR